MNPQLGLRAIRFCLKEVEQFKVQLRAIIRAGAFGKLRVMFPMVSASRRSMKPSASSISSKGT